MPLIVIKLGGSVITYKNSQIPKPRKKVIKRLAHEIKDLYNNNLKIILVHGGGSYGHNLAKKYDLLKGLKTPESLMGLAKTVQSMNKLNAIIMNLLENAGLPAVSFPPHSFITQTSRKLNEFDTTIIKNVLDQGFIPVLYGDGVIDTKQGASILSGDTIVTYLAKKLKTQKVIFLSDVDGVYDKNPKANPSAKLISQITDKNLKYVIKSLKIQNSNDVTGEMLGKILSVKNNLGGIKVTITNGLLDEVLNQVIHQQKVGTELYFEL